MRKRVVGSVVGVAGAIALGIAMVPFRAHTNISTPALVLVIPVVVGAALGGFVAGISSVLAGILVYDYLFIPPYHTLGVVHAQDLTALAVYVVVMVLVARVVASLDSSRLEAERGGAAAHRISELSELLVGDRPVDDLLHTIVSAIHTGFDVPAVALLVLDDGRLQVAAEAGEKLSPEDLNALAPASGETVSVATTPGAPGDLRTIALTASGRPVGMLALRGLPTTAVDRAVLTTFANDAALALERARLREQALRSQLLEEVDRFRQGLMGAVSHDLRTPLATIKVASSTLVNRSGFLEPEQARELYSLIEVESDRLTRLVTNLLDMTRIEAGVLVVHRTPVPVAQLIRDALKTLAPALGDRPVDVAVAFGLPEVDVDPLLIGQVLINLLDNANRHAPALSPIEVMAGLHGDHVTVSITDHGPGIPENQRAHVFDRFARLDAGGWAGLGLTIVKTFVDAHGEKVWYEDAPGGGARFVVSLPVATFEDAGT